MDKIIATVLECKFPSINIYAIMDVINATPNPVIAAEILLGIYQTPILPEESMVERNTICKYVSFDKYKEQVKYKFTRTRTRTNYFTTKEEMEACTEFNSNLPTYSGNDKYPFSKSFEVQEEDTSYTSLQDWQNKAIVL